MQAFELLKRGDLFRNIPPQDLKRLAQACEVKLIDAGKILVRAGSPQNSVVYIAQGQVALYRRNAKRDVTLLLGLVEGPSLFGDAECAAEMPWMCSVRAETEAWCVLIPNAIFLKAVDSHLALASALYRDASVRHLLANHTAQTLALHDVETRLVRLLLDYAYRSGTRDGDEATIDKPLSQVEMAAALGVTRKTISRTLQPLESRGVVSRENGGWRLHGLAQLEADLPRDLLPLSSRYGDQVAAVSQSWAGEDIE